MFNHVNSLRLDINFLQHVGPTQHAYTMYKPGDVRKVRREARENLFRLHRQTRNGKISFLSGTRWPVVVLNPRTCVTRKRAWRIHLDPDVRYYTYLPTYGRSREIARNEALIYTKVPVVAGEDAVAMVPPRRIWRRQLPRKNATVWRGVGVYERTQLTCTRMHLHAHTHARVIRHPTQSLPVPVLTPRVRC